MPKQLTRADLVRLVEHIQTASGCVTDLDALLNQFESQVARPEISAWIFDPPSGKRMSPEQIVDAALDNR